MKGISRIVAGIMVCIFCFMTTAAFEYEFSFAEGTVTGESKAEDAYIKVEPIDVEGVYTREQILDWYGIFDVNELANIKSTEIVSDGNVQTLNLALADDVYYGGTDGYAEEWLVSDGVISEQFIDLDSDGTDEYFIIYIDSTAEDVYDYVYIETAAYAVVFETEGDYYVYADSMKVDIGYSYERFIRIVNGEKGTYILQGGIAYWDGGSGGVNAQIFGYDGEKLYMAVIARASTEGSFVLNMRSEPEDADELMDLCDDYYYYADEAAAAGIVEGENYFYTDGSYDVFDYEDGSLNIDCFVGIDNVAAMLSPFGVDVGYTIEDGSYYELYLNGGENIYYANEEWYDGSCIIVMELSANVDFEGGYRLKAEDAEENVIDWSKPYAYVESAGNTNPEKGTLLTEDMLGQVIQVQDRVGGWFRFVAPYDGDYSFMVLSHSLKYDNFNIALSIDGNVYQWMNYSESDEVQTNVVKGVKAGQVLEWWDEDGSGRGYTSLDPFMLMISVDSNEPLFAETESEECRHDGGVYYTEHPDHEEKCALCDETMPLRTTDSNVHISGLSTCGYCFSAYGPDQFRAIEMAGYSYDVYDMPERGGKYLNRIEIADVRGNFTWDNTFPVTEAMITVSETVDHELIVTVTFEGSQDIIDDWLRDANAVPYNGIHTGVYNARKRFLDAYIYNADFDFEVNFMCDGVLYDEKMSLNKLFTIVRDNPGAHLRITGHSYGGALAQVFTVWAIEEFKIPANRIETYTFASLVPFTKDFVREHTALRNVRVYNYIHAQDYVPDLGVTSELYVVEPEEYEINYNEDGFLEMKKGEITILVNDPNFLERIVWERAFTVNMNVDKVNYVLNSAVVKTSSVVENAGNIGATLILEMGEEMEDYYAGEIIGDAGGIIGDQLGVLFGIDAEQSVYDEFTSEYKLGGFTISGSNIGTNVYLYSDMNVGLSSISDAHVMVTYIHLLHDERDPYYFDVIEVLE